MARYRAIGKYAVDATDAEKVKALKETLCDAAMELIDLGMSELAVEDALDEAMQAAVDQAESLRV